MTSPSDKISSTDGGKKKTSASKSSHVKPTTEGNSSETIAATSAVAATGGGHCGNAHCQDEKCDSQAPLGNIQELRKAMNMLQLYSMGAGGGAKAGDEAERKEFKFWKTQPVPQLDEEVKTCEPIEKEKSIDQIKPDSYNLPAGYKWVTMNVDDDQELVELYKLLTENYVEDNDNMFRFDYSPQFLRWALKPPNWKAEWHCGVRVEKSGKLVGFISGTPASVRVNDKVISMVEINFLCVHKILRSKRMAPVLIKEITRRVNLHGIFQAVYTAGIVLPKPVGSCKYWHRSLNPKKLISVKFSHLGRNMTVQRTVKFYKLPEKPKTPGYRPIQPEDFDQAYALLTEYLKKFDLVPIYSPEEFRHWFTPQEDVVNSFVVEDPESKKIVAFSSFYTLPSSVMHHPTYKNIKAAYSFYNVPSDQVDLKTLMTDTLIAAKNLDYDVFNALDLMDNSVFLEYLKFGRGDGDLQYYLYNWKCPTMPANKIGLVLQ